MISFSEKTIPLYILSSVLDGVISIAVMLPTENLSDIISSKCSSILEHLSVAFIKKSTEDSVVIEIENGSKVYFLTNPEHCRGLRLNECILVRVSDMRSGTIETIVSGFVAIQKNNSISSISDNDIIVVKRKNA